MIQSDIYDPAEVYEDEDLLSDGGEGCKQDDIIEDITNEAARGPRINSNTKEDDDIIIEERFSRTEASDKKPSVMDRLAPR